MQPPETIAREVESWIVARRAVQVAERLLADDPGNPALTERLGRATAQAKDSGSILRAALRAHGYSPEDLQRLCASTA